MKQDKAQQAARDEKLVPLDDRVKIGKSNLRMDPSVTQKEETYQVILDIIKNTPYYNAFLIYANVLKIYMQQFWLTIKKVKRSSFYQFDIDNKTCQIDVELFREILDICPRVQNQEFTELPTSDPLLEFLLDLGYKGQLKQISEITLVTNDIKNSEAYKTFIGISTGLIPPKKGRGKGAQGTKGAVILKKATFASRKKKQKMKVSIHDESSDEESEEHEKKAS
ncbi:hypothetical protein Tco_1216811 [Tanacetum coccineum]